VVRLFCEKTCQHDVAAEEQHGGDGRRDEHLARAGRADIDAVPHECRHAAQGQQRRPRQIDVRCSHHGSVVGQQTQKVQSAKGIDRREHDDQPSAPHKHGLHCAAECLTVAGPVELAAHRFGGVGEAVHHVGEQERKLQQQRVDRQHSVALSCACAGEEEHHRHHEERAEEDVDIDSPPPTPPDRGRGLTI